MLAMRLVNPSAIAASDSMNAAKLAMLGANSPVVNAPSQQLQSPSSCKASSPTTLDRELLQHYAYLRYGDAGNRDSSGRKQHICPVKTCGRRFSTPGNLSRHKRLHGPIKPLKCPVASCICAFRSENKLEKHMKFHLGIPVHVCPVPACGKTFSTAGNLNRHIKGHHPHIDPLAIRRRSNSGSIYSASSSCDDEYESSVGGDEVILKRCEDEREQAVPLAELSSADQFATLAAMLDEDMGGDGNDATAVAMDATSASTAASLESESMLSLLLQDDGDGDNSGDCDAAPSSHPHNLLDDIIRFHISHIITEESPTPSHDDHVLFV